MFEYGQKVIVTNSSHRGKVGPRKGSIGYVLGSDSGKIVKRTANKIPFCVESLLVIFVRYGFGKEREEPETRKMLNVFPILSSYGQGAYRKEAFKMFIGEVEGKSDNVWPIIRWEMKSKANIPICMLHPMENAEDIRNFNNINFKAWYKSIVRSWTFSRNLDKTRPDFKQEKYKPEVREYFSAIRDSANDRRFREKVFSAVFSSDKTKREIIHTVKYLQFMFTTVDIKRYMKNMARAYDDNIYNDGPFLKHDSVYQAITSLVFNPVVLKLNLELMKNRGLDHRNIKKDLMQTLHMMRENAQPLYSIKS